MQNNKVLKIIFALIGIFCVGVGVAFNASTHLGNDAIGMIYDGIRVSLRLTTEQLGLVSNLLNITLIILLIFTGRRYVNIGTIIYILPYGAFVNIGTFIYHIIFPSQSLISRFVAGTIGCALIYLGVAIFIAMDIGLDPFTGIVMLIRDKTKKEYKSIKIIFDIILVLIGFLLGGTFGIFTIITAFTAGPSIQWISNQIIAFMNTSKATIEPEYSLDD